MKRFDFVTVNTREEIVPGLKYRMFIVPDGESMKPVEDFIKSHKVKSINGVSTSDIEVIKRCQAKWNTFVQLMTNGTKATV